MKIITISPVNCATLTVTPAKFHLLSVLAVIKMVLFLSSLITSVTQVVLPALFTLMEFAKNVMRVV